MQASNTFIVQAESLQEPGSWIDLSYFDQIGKADRHLEMERRQDEGHKFRLIVRTEIVLRGASE